MDSTSCRWMTFWGFSHEVPMPNYQDPLARSHQELWGRSAHRSRSGVGSHHTPPELHLWSHCQASWRHASPPSTLVSCRSDSRPSSRPKLEALPRSSQQPMDWPATQGQQQHATSWPVGKIDDDDEHKHVVAEMSLRCQYLVVSSTKHRYHNYKISIHTVNN